MYLTFSDPSPITSSSLHTENLRGGDRLPDQLNLADVRGARGGRGLRHHGDRQPGRRADVQVRCRVGGRVCRAAAEVQREPHLHPGGARPAVLQSTEHRCHD